MVNFTFARGSNIKFKSKEKAKKSDSQQLEQIKTDKQINR